MWAEKGLEGHTKTLSLTVQTRGSHEGQQGTWGGREAGRQGSYCCET